MMLKKELRRVEYWKEEMHLLTTRPRDELIEHYARACRSTREVHREFLDTKRMRLKL
jgi:hypothetical protein